MFGHIKSLLVVCVVRLAVAASSRLIQVAAHTATNRRTRTRLDKVHSRLAYIGPWNRGIILASARKRSRLSRGSETKCSDVPPSTSTETTAEETLARLPDVSSPREVRETLSRQGTSFWSSPDPYLGFGQTP